MTKNMFEENIEYIADQDVMSQKPENCITHEEIIYNYGDFKDYEYVGLYMNQNQEIERLYRTK